MRHAYLILAHGQQVELENLIKRIDDPRNDIYLHIDKKCNSINVDKVQASLSWSKLYPYKSISVSWGGFSMIEAELLLFQAAYDASKYRYFHLLSGVDLPVKSQDYIHQFMKDRDGENFISPITYASEVNVSIRYEQYHLLQDSLIGKQRNIWKYIDFASCYLQKLIGIQRQRGNIIKPSIQWVSVTDELVKYLLSKQSEIRHNYRWSYCCDELFLLSTIWETGLRDTISELGNLRFMEWKWFSKHDNSPRPLTDSDLKQLSSTNILFARKFVLPYSESILERLPTQ